MTRQAWFWLTPTKPDLFAISFVTAVLALQQATHGMDAVSVLAVHMYLR